MLASLGSERIFDDVPTLSELGYTTGVGLMNRIVMAPKGMPAADMQKLRDAFAALQKDKTYNKMMGKLGENTELMMGPDYEKIRMQQSEQYKKLVQAITGN